MGCGGSKAGADADPLPITGMGGVGRAFGDMFAALAATNLSAGNRRTMLVSVMTGRWEIERDKLDPDHSVAMGETPFGLVYEGFVKDARLDNVRNNPDKAQNMLVIVKKLALGALPAQRSSFLKEIQYMKEINHDNVMRLIAVVTTEEPFLMIFENHRNGVLKPFLAANRTTGVVTPQHLVRMTAHVARGLAFLADKKVVHKDLSSRNCLVADDLTVRIGDFGLSREKFASDYMQIGGTGPVLPVRWMAPECIANVQRFTLASDVWSLGVVAWEITSFGNLPYPQLTNAEVVGHITAGNPLPAPKATPPHMWEVVVTCLAVDIAARPTAAAVASQLDALLIDMPPIVAVVSVSLSGDATYAEPQDTATAALDADLAKIAREKSSRNYRSLQMFKNEDNPGAALTKLGHKDVREWPRALIALHQELGRGAFGEVRRGVLTRDDKSTVDCAVKTLRGGALDDDRDALLAEAFLVSQFEHPNVVACYGQITVGEPAMIIFEFMQNGSLFGYIKDRDEDLPLQRKIKMAIDISGGMSYLEAHKHVHRDLATRNILVDTALACKISDFGLSRDLADEQYYQSEGGMVPIRWTAPEAYKYKKYSTASDVWSFGITLNEIWTKVGLPYGKAWTNMNVMMEVERGYRLPPPPNCPKAIYKLMIDCWNPRRLGRPSFKSLNTQLQMAYDMLFAADDGAVLTVKDDYGAMDQMYLGVPMPNAENLDDEGPYLVPTPLAASAKPAAEPINRFAAATISRKEAQAKKEQEDRAKGWLPGPAPTTPSRSAGVGAGASTAAGVPARAGSVSKFYEETTLTEEEFNALPDEEKARRAYMRQKKGSLRRQKVGAAERTDDGDGGVAYMSHKKVADVIALSRDKEKVTEQLEKGLIKAQAEGESVEQASKTTFIENVGRAREAEAGTQIAGRKKCVCRRFKCVCDLG